MFVGTSIFDGVCLVTDDLPFVTVSFLMAVLAAVGGVAAAATGAVDLKNIPKGTRAKRVGLGTRSATTSSLACSRSARSCATAPTTTSPPRSLSP